jgi:hypothetical protein
MMNYLHLFHFTPLHSIFLQHPEEQNMTYLEHLRHACSYGLQAMASSLAFIIHGFIPCLFEKTGSTRIQNLHTQLQLQHSNNKKHCDETN